MKVLLVDDEPSARRRLARMLSTHDDVETVGEAQDGLEALNLLEALKPDVMFLDIQMPELDGFGVVRGMSLSALTGSVRMVRAAISGEPGTGRSFKSRTKMLWHMPNGLTNACQRRRSGSSPRAEGWIENPTFGAMKRCPGESTWPIRFKGISRTATRRKTAFKKRVPFVRFW